MSYIAVFTTVGKLADAQASYQLMTNLYRKHVDLLKMALGRGS